jgi:hypothetical protein
MNKLLPIMFVSLNQQRRIMVMLAEVVVGEVLIINLLVVLKRNLRILPFQVIYQKLLVKIFFIIIFLKMKMALDLIYKNVLIAVVILRLIESTNMLMFVEEKKNEKFLTVPR